jgi:undecaprenyl pyrophosphate phosphatase UppP
VLFKLTKLANDGIPEGFLTPMIVGIVAAGISGWAAMWGMMRMLRSRNFNGFVIYRVTIGVGVLLLAASSVR